jgi:hypothetical protein
MVGRGSCHIDDDSCYATGVLTGGAVGMVAAASIDQWLAFDRHEPGRQVRGLVVAPSVTLGQSRGSLGLAGVF